MVAGALAVADEEMLLGALLEAGVWFGFNDEPGVTALINFFWLLTALDDGVGFMPRVLSATSLAKVPPVLLPGGGTEPEFLMVFFNDCMMLVYDAFVEETLLGGRDDKRFPSLLSPTNVEAAEVLEEIILDIWEAFPGVFPENRFFAAGGRAGIPPVTDFPVAAANTAEAVTGLF